MNYQETLAWMFSRLPMYHRIGAAAYKANLDNILSLCNFLGNPQNSFDSIHVAGTNGKGSVCHMLASVLQEHGLRVGLFTSPHLRDFRERIRVNGQMIPEEKVTGFIRKFLPENERIKPSFFELTTALAFDHFREEQVDISVIETGMGGRLDSTNVVIPILSVITNVSHDHMQFLGNTIEKIALEKAGIIKPGIPVLIGEEQPESAYLFRKTASSRGAPIFFAREVAEQTAGLYCPLEGHYQEKNLLTVEGVLTLMKNLGIEVPSSTIRRGIELVVENTGLQGRWQILGTDPLTICDTGHNEAGLKEVTAQLRTIGYRRLHWVFGVVNDKDIIPMLKLLPPDAVFYFCKADVPRGLDAAVLCAEARNLGLSGESYPSVGNALRAARDASGPLDLVFIGGSTFVVAEALP